MTSATLTPPEAHRTARLLLRRPRPDDAEAIFAAYASDGEVTRFLTWRPHRDVDETRAFLAVCDDDWRGGRVFPYLICDSSNGDAALGMIDVRIDGHRASYGYVLARSAWGRGFTPEALRCLVDWSLAQPRIERAWAFCDIDNRPSARVMEKAGLRFEGILHRWFVHPNVSDRPRDCRVYARCKA